MSMFQDEKISRRKLLQIGGTAAAAAPLLSPLRSFAQEKSPIVLECWTPAASFPATIDAYKEVRPDVQINVLSVPWKEHNIKLRNAIRAGGAGLPDFAHVQMADLLSWTMTGEVANLAQFGADQFRGDYTNWIWKHMTMGGGVKALPVDFGPLILYYRKDILEGMGLPVPTTWDEFREVGAMVRKKDSSVYMTNCTLNYFWLRGMFWQAGETPFAIEGTKIKIDIANEEAMKVAAYWQGLIDDDIASVRPGYTQEWFTGMDAGQYACWPGPAWSTNRLQMASKKALGKWRMALIPQWSDADKFMTGNLGGSCVIMFDKSKKKEEAAKFIFWALHGPGSWALANKGMLVALKSVQESEKFLSMTQPIYGDQRYMEVVTKSANAISPKFLYSPFEDFVQQTLIEEGAQVMNRKGTLPDAVRRTQERVAEYAEQQGFTVV